MKVGSEKSFVYKIPYRCARSTFRLGARKQSYFANKKIIGKTALVFVCKIPLLDNKVSCIQDSVTRQMLTFFLAMVRNKSKRVSQNYKKTKISCQRFAA